MIYLDNNATTRVFDCVVEAMRPYFVELYANPASAIGHFAGIPRVIAVEKKRLSAALGAESGDQFVITSGATESNNLAIFGAARANRHRRHVVISAIEHPSVLEAVEVLRLDGYQISTLPVGSDGVIDLSKLADVLSQDTLLVSVMMVNNETGVIQPVHTVATIVKSHDPSILIHSDATQAVGKIPVNLECDLAGVDLLSFSAHKFHGPKGIGALFVRNRDKVAPLLYGGGQQGGSRPGTENPAGVVGMVTALMKLLGDQDVMASTRILRDRLEVGILAAHPRSFVLGASAQRLPTTLNVCLPEVDADNLVDQMAANGIAISTGSACAYGARKPSYVATALGLSYEQARSCVRISLSVESTPEEINAFLNALTETLERGSAKQSVELETRS